MHCTYTMQWLLRGNVMQDMEEAPPSVSTCMLDESPHCTLIAYLLCTCYLTYSKFICTYTSIDKFIIELMSIHDTLMSVYRKVHFNEND